jgi:carboxymethylenebutenolidase
MSEAEPGDWARGFALYSAYNFDGGVGDIAATVAAARTLKGGTGKVGVTGYCLGGLMTYLTAARADADAFVSTTAAAPKSTRPKRARSASRRCTTWPKKTNTSARKRKPPSRRLQGQSQD